MLIAPSEFSAWFEKRVQDAGSVDKLAAETGISRQTLYDLYRGGFPRAAVAEKLGIKLNVPKVSA